MNLDFLLILSAVFGAGCLRAVLGFWDKKVERPRTRFDYLKLAWSVARGGVFALGYLLVDFQDGIALPATATAAFAFVFGLSGEYLSGSILNVVQEKLDVKTLVEFFKLLEK